MKNNYLFLVTVFSIAVFVFTACQKLEPSTQVTFAEPQLPLQTKNYESLEYPEHFNTFNINTGGIMEPGFFPGNFLVNPNNPQVTNDGATLGRVLFYDPQLSINNSVSCGSCHHQSKAFSDGLTGSVGFAGKVTPRNSMAIANASMNNNLFWDSRVQSLPDLIMEPIQNHVEMGMEDLNILTRKLAAIDYYPELFEKAYGSKKITQDRIANSVAQFLSSMKSVNSKFDQGIESDFENYTQMERLGHELFFSERTQCSGCHAGANFAAPDFPGGDYGGDFFEGGNGDVKGTTNIGLDLNTNDQGLRDGRFRIPSLRNTALTAPYMHDGRFESLEEVIEHYDNGIQSHPQLDPKFISEDGSPKRMNLTSIEKQALVAFLHTLTDEVFTKDEMFSDPFTK